jgi:ABC-type methionine transport system ATPase subunit
VYNFNEVITHGGNMAIVKVELTIPTNLKDEPIIYTMGRDFKVIPNIVEASFSTSMGWAVLNLEGEKPEIDKLMESLRQKDIKVKLL